MTTPPARPPLDAPSTDPGSSTSGDLVAGSVFAVLGLAAALTGVGYGLGSLREMGPGMFPFLIGLGLLGLGLGVLAPALRGSGELTPGLSRFPWRGVACVLGAVLFFAYAISPLGFLITTLGTALLACLASASTTIARAALASTGITVACYLVFVVGLSLQLPLLP